MIDVQTLTQSQTENKDENDDDDAIRFIINHLSIHNFFRFCSLFLFSLMFSIFITIRSELKNKCNCIKLTKLISLLYPAAITVE